MYFNPEPDGPGFYAVTRYADIREVHRNVDIYSSEIGGTSLEDLDEEQLEARKSMIDMDPPRHDELRGLIARRFTPRAVQVWEDAVRDGHRPRARHRAGAGRVRLRRRRSRRRSRCRCSPRSSASRRTTGATSSSSATGCSATRTRSTSSRRTRRTGCCRSPARPRSRCSSSGARWPRRGASTRATTSSPSSRSSRSPSASSTSTSSCSPRPGTRRRGTRSRTG